MEAIINPFLAFTFSTMIFGCAFKAHRGRLLSTEHINSLPSGLRGPAPQPGLSPPLEEQGPSRGRSKIRSKGNAEKCVPFRNYLD